MDSDDWDILKIIGTVVGVIILVIATIGNALDTISTHYETNAMLARCAAIQATANAARDSEDDQLEGAAFRMSIAECNAKIAEAKYYRSTIWTYMYPATVDKAEYIK